MHASSRSAELEDTQQIATRAPSGNKVARFTRHPRALARVSSLPLRPAARFTLETLLTYANKEGVCCVGVATLAASMPRSADGTPYAIVSVDRSMKELRAAGWVDWRRVKPCGRYPSGRWTLSGGRVWRVNLAALRGECPPLPFDGMNSGGVIPPGGSWVIPPPILWFLLRRNKWIPRAKKPARPRPLRGP